MDGQDDLKIEYQHFRIPQNDPRGAKRRGRPPDEILVRYSRGRRSWLGPVDWDFYGVLGVPQPAPRGGRTVCIITLLDGSELHGRATCSLADQFSYRVGRDIARGRALKSLDVQDAKEA